MILHLYFGEVLIVGSYLPEFENQPTVHASIIIRKHLNP